MIGGVLAAATLLVLFNATCVHFEATHNIVRGMPGSQLSAMWFGEYFPNPAVYGTDAEAFLQVGVKTAFLAEAIGTAFLLFFIMALTDHRNDLSASKSNMHPLFIGFAVAIIISILAPLTQAGLNPMRDFAPRLVAYFAGWGSIAIPGPRGCDMWVYILAPLVGGLVGAGLYQALIHAAQVAAEEGRQEQVA
jgi:glycerol uptake facilitator protein